MNLEKHYTDLWENALQKFQAGVFEQDPFLNADEDNRFGITLLFRPNNSVKDFIQAFLQELRELEPEQYYYPASDVHVTVMSVISCHAGFELSDIPVAEYVAVLQECLANVKSFNIDFKGITASPSCVMVQGFPATEQLHMLRNKLRACFRKTHLPQSIDSRYVLQTAHATIMRFKSPLQNPDKFLSKLNAYRSHSFGSMQVEQVDLVYNDWYQRQAAVQHLSTFMLK